VELVEAQAVEGLLTRVRDDPGAGAVMACRWVRGMLPWEREATSAVSRSPLLTVLLVGSALARAQGTALPQASPEDAAYEKFRSWAGLQPREVQDAADLLERYRAKLLAEGVLSAAADEQLRVIREHGRRLEVERWNHILTAPVPKFNTKPNAFLVEMTQGALTGIALDVGMGQGRNALYLAQQGWDVTGFDPAEKAVAAAQGEAERLGLKLTTYTMGDEEFDFGMERWDLVVLSYVSLRHLPSRVYDSLKPGGRVVIEGFHRDATKTSPIGGGVVFDTNELLTLFSRFRILRYEDVPSIGDFGLRQTRVVRLCAQKP
jgi:2-polyprenyl-3-methyl-5-hydroxy-6-metoxy-1,4-benzoquinol methylase